MSVLERTVRERRDAGDLAGALSALDEAIAREPEALPLLGSRAEIRRRLGDLEGCAADAVKMIAVAPREPAGYVSRAEALRGAGRYAAALAALSPALRAAPGDAWVRVVRAKVRREMGDNAAALADCDAALSLEPRSAKAHAWRGEVLRALGRGAQALSALDEGVRLDGQAAWIRALRGQTRAENGRPDEGEADLETAFSMDRRCSAAYDFLGREAGGLARDPLCAWVYAWRGAASSGLSDLDHALELDPRWAWVHCRRGEARLKAGLIREGLRDLERAVALHPQSARSRFWRAEARRLCGDPSGAMSDLNLLLRLDPGLSSPMLTSGSGYAGPAYISRALARQALGDRRGMVCDFRRGWSLSPLDLREKVRTLVGGTFPIGTGAEEGLDEGFWASWSQRRFRRGQGRRVAARVRTLLRRHPRSGLLHLLAWRALDPFGRGSSRNVRRLERAIALGFDEPAAHAWLGAARLDQGRYRQGLAGLSRAVELDPARAWEHASWPRDARGSEAHRLNRKRLEDLGGPGAGPLVRFLRARILQNLGRHEESFSEMEKARALFSGCPWFAECALGEAALKAGRMRQALAFLDRAVELDPSQARSLAWRGEVRYWLGREAEAEEDFRAAALAQPDAPWIHAWRGEFLLWTGRYAEAERALDRALELDSGNAWAYAWRAGARAGRGKLREALSDADRAVRTDPADVEARIWRGEVLARLGRKESALRELDRACRTDPERVWIYPVRAWIRGLSGDREGMLEDYASAKRLAPGLFSVRGEPGPRPSAAAAFSDVKRALRQARGNRTYRRNNEA